MLHERAIIDIGSEIGAGTNVWANTHICTGAILGKECTIGENVFIGPDVIIGDRCRIQNGALIYKGVEIGNDVLIGPGVVTTNDHFPALPVDDWSHRFKRTVIQDGVSIGANSTIVCGVTLHKGCMIGAGSVVTKDVEENSIVIGNPAKHYKWKSEY